MGVDMNRIAAYHAQNHSVQFMQAQDYTTKKDDAKEIHEFLTNKNKQIQRQEELAAYLLGMTDENGNRTFTYDEAVAAAKQQVENEKSQKNAQVTQVFIDEISYNKAIAEAEKNGTRDLYNFKLITDKELLGYINQNKDLFFDVDDNGKQVFNSDKFKTEFGQDVGTDNKLQLLERENGANKRKISKTAEKNAIKAAGLDYRRDNTGLYRTLAGSAAVAALAFGFATASAKAVGVFATAKAHSSAVGAGITGALAAGGSAFVINDKDGKTNKRQNAADLFAQKPQESATTQQTIQTSESEEVEGEEQEEEVEETSNTNQTGTTTQTDEPEESPCYRVIKPVAVKTIRFGGYWHYANLYNNCETGKPLTNAQIMELTQLLKPGHERSSIQKGDDNRTRNLIPEITLKDGTKVCLADSAEIAARVAKMVTKKGGKDMPLNPQQNIIVDCQTGELVQVAA